MNFIESIFGISPDGGTGITESMIIMLVPVMVLLYYACKRIVLRWAK